MRVTVEKPAIAIPTHCYTHPAWGTSDRGFIAIPMKIDFTAPTSVTQIFHREAYPPWQLHRRRRRFVLMRRSPFLCAEIYSTLLAVYLRLPLLSAEGCAMMRADNAGYHSSLNWWLLSEKILPGIKAKQLVALTRLPLRKLFEHVAVKGRLCIFLARSLRTHMLCCYNLTVR